MELMNGIAYHGAGATSASICYTPQKMVKGWSWQTYWLAQALVCWLLLPLLIAFITIPQLGKVLSEAPTSPMWYSFFLGMAYGVGGTAFGLAIRYVGFSLTYAIAVGISCVLGTLLPPLVSGEIATLMQSQGSSFLASGVMLGAVGIGICGVAGRMKEKQLSNREDADAGKFNLRKGLPLCLLAGVLSAMYGFALSVGQPVADVAEQFGAGQYQGNVIYIFANSGAFISTMVYCIYLHTKENTMGEYWQQGNKKLGINYLMAMLTGLLWYGQFFFYGLGHTRMGRYDFSSWAIHMILLVLISSLTGILFKEWQNTSRMTIIMLILAMLILISAVVLLTIGNRMGAEG